MNDNRIKILLCCGAGFSSSALAQKMKNDIIMQGLNDKVMIEFCPFALINERLTLFDIIICCPHLRVDVKNYLKKNILTIPIYILPPRMYGMMDIKEIYQDCKDIISLFNQGCLNPVHFPGEENVMRITRCKAYNHK